MKYIRSVKILSSFNFFIYNNTLAFQKRKSDFYHIPFSSLHWLCIEPTKFEFYSVAYTLLYDLTFAYVVNLRNTISTTFMLGFYIRYCLKKMILVI